MTVDATPPDEKDIAYRKLDRNVDLYDAFDTSLDMKLLPPDDWENGKESFSIELEDLALKLNKAVAKIIFYRARNTEAWSKGRAGSPSYNSKTVFEVLDRIEILEIVDTATRDILTQIGTGNYRNKNLNLEIEVNNSRDIDIRSYDFPDPDV